MIPGLVSTVIPVYNRPDMLSEAVHSVLAQTYRPIEVIIVDDGSTDATPQVAEALAHRHPATVRLLRIANSGPGPAREAGRCVADGEFIQYLDSDDRLLPEKFEYQVRALRNHPECDIAYGLTRLVDAQGGVLKAPFKWTGRQIPQLFPGLLVDRWWCTHTPLYRRSLTDAIGPWSALRWSQDWEYDARVGALGTRLVHCLRYVSEHRHHAGQRQTALADWATDPERLRNRVALLAALWVNADKAAVRAECPERQHFARWAFLIARQCGAAGLVAESRTCLDLAASAAGTTGPGRRGLSAYRWLVRILGDRQAGRLAERVAVLKKNPSRLTLPQSFAQ